MASGSGRGVDLKDLKVEGVRYVEMHRGPPYTC